MAKSWEPWVVENLMPWEKNRKGGRQLKVEGSSFAFRASVVLIPIYILFLLLM
jgi:hypothetical protein